LPREAPRRRDEAAIQRQLAKRDRALDVLARDDLQCGKKRDGDGQVEV